MMTIPRFLSPGRRKSRRISQSHTFALCLIAVAGACSADSPVEPALADNGIEVSAAVPMFEGAQVAHFLIRNRTSAPLQMGACADGIDVMVIGRWLPIRAAIDCDAALRRVEPDAFGWLTHPLDDGLPQGIYRARFSVRRLTIHRPERIELVTATFKVLDRRRGVGTPHLQDAAPRTP